MTRTGTHWDEADREGIMRFTMQHLADGVSAQKLCECGCGEPAPIATYNCLRDGFVKGQPIRFIKFHQPKGAKAHRWTGGRIKNTAGYVLIKQPHPRANKGYVFEHILIAEQALGGVLHPENEVHHFNEQKADNRNANLVICENRAYHCLLHRRARAYRVCGDPSARKCWICKQWGHDVVDKSHLNCRRLKNER